MAVTRPGDIEESFRRLYPFTLDAFQDRACRALRDGRDVLVAAPTGSGKTVVGEYAVHLAVSGTGRCFYTTPIKALSNQKYTDLCRRYGEHRVGLLTGDNSINADAAVVVMTTEVLRNMLYAESPTLRRLRFVVMDEVHYLADKDRGPVWEEVIITLPGSVRLVSLSATVSNAEEFGQWLGTVRGPTDVVVEERRPVPLWQHVMVGTQLYDLFVDEAQERVNPELVRLARQSAQLARSPDRRPARGGRRPQVRDSHLTPRRSEVVERLRRSGLLPAIVFVFSRAGCDAAVEQALLSGARLTDSTQAAAVDRIVADRCRLITPADRAVLGFDQWQATLRRGFAAHHAGLLPIFKQTVEELVSQGLVKVVYATETLALGINMPARSVVLERLVKWNGEQHAEVTAGEYTQLSGRAGRRGIDVEGHGVVAWHPGLDPVALGGLASTRTYPLRSSFRPSYNMAVNLVHQRGREKSRRLLESSFAQFLIDRSTVGMAVRRRRLTEAIEGYAEAMTCSRGDFSEYAALRRALKDVENAAARGRRAHAAASAQAAVGSWRVGDVLDVPAGRARGLVVVLSAATGDPDAVSPLVLTESRQVRRLAPSDLRHTPRRVATIRVPRGFDRKAAGARRALVASMRAAVRAEEPAAVPRGAQSVTHADREDAESLRSLVRAHPCHGCPDREEHARWAERRWQAERDLTRLEEGMGRRRGSIATDFDRVCAVLDTMGYLDDDTVTPAGTRLRGLFGELDLLAAQCLRLGVWEGLHAPDLAACAAALTFQARGAEPGPTAHHPAGAVRGVLEDMVGIWEDLHGVESEHGLDYLRPPDLGFCAGVQRWAAGHTLQAVLAEQDMTPGDFVRSVRQVLDLLDQLAKVAGSGSVRDTARGAMTALNRGVVAYDTLG